MSKADLAAKSMDVTARGIDLLTALTETANSPHSIVQVGIELGRWLGREKLSEDQLQFCLEKARGLVIANSRGHQFYEAVSASTRERAVGPLFVQQSGSLGRMMAKDPFLCWMTSTIACLFEFHGENFISDVLCSFIMQAHMQNDGKGLKEYQLAWHPLRLQLKPVLQKIVSSIWFNVVNSGVVKADGQGNPTSLPMPPKLKEVCPRGHNLESHRLGVILCQLRELQGEVIIESTNVISNLALWLIYHFKGRLRVIVSGKIVYDQLLGPEGSIIEHRTQKFCSIDGPCDETSNAKVKVYSSISGNLKKIFTGSYDTQMTMEQVPRTRQKLYQPLRYPPGASGGESIRTLVRQTAFEIASWILKLHVSREASSNELSFSVILDGNNGDEKSEDLLVSDLLARVPSIVNMGWGDIKAAVVVFSPPVAAQTSPAASNDDTNEMDFDDDHDLDLSDSDSAFTEATPEYILQYFPILRDLMEKVRKSCRCHHCAHPKQNAKLQEGCLRYTTFMEVMTYIAHSIADAFGADDCSGYGRNMEDLGVVRILWDIIGHSMRWRSWLDTASRVLLGSPSIEELTDTLTDEDYTVKSDFMDADQLVSTVIALQHGNLAVVAPWLDISQPLKISRCFGFKIIQGRLGVIANDGSQFQSLQGESSVIETQHSDDVQSYADRFPLDTEKAGSQVRIETDLSTIQTHFLLVSSGSTRYKLLMRVVSDSHSRFLDPARSMIKSAQPTMTTSCKHGFDSKATIQQAKPVLKIYNFDQLLGRWPDAQKGDTGDSTNAPRAWRQATDGQQSDSDEDEAFPAGQYHQIPAPGEGVRDPTSVPTLRVSQMLDSYLKYNTALALMYDDVTILNHGSACLACLLDTVMGLEPLNGIENIDGNRWVICRSKHPETEVYLEDQRREFRKRIKATA